MSYTRLYVEPTEALKGQGMKSIPASNGQSCRLRLFSGPRSPKLLVSITTDRPALSGSIYPGDNDGLVRR